MKKILFWLVATLVFVACNPRNEVEVPDTEKDSLNIPAFCQQLRKMTVADVDKVLTARGFELMRDSTETTIKMGPYSSHGVIHWYYYNKRNEEGAIYQWGQAKIVWLDGEIVYLQYRDEKQSFTEQLFVWEEELHKYATANNWISTYGYYEDDLGSREDILRWFGLHPQGYNICFVRIADPLFDSLPINNGTAFGFSNIRQMGVSKYQHPSSYMFEHICYYDEIKNYVNIPTNLYLPDDTIRVGEYLPKHSKMVQPYGFGNINKDYWYSVYQDKDLFLWRESKPYVNYGKFYACGFAYFVPAGAVDLDGNKVTHTSSDESVLVVESDESIAGQENEENVKIRAVAPGKATLTVRWKNLSTTATITVIE